MLERIPPRWRDAGIAAAVGVVSLSSALSLDSHTVLVAGPVVVASGVLLARRSHPLLVLGVVVAAHVLALTQHSGNVLLAAAVAFYGAASFLTRGRALIGGAAASVACLGAALSDTSTRPYSSVSAVIALGGVWLVGDNARVRRERERERAHEAVADERARIARELHDVVTHNVSVMVVQAAAGNDVFDARPDQARQALAAVEETGRRALGELRSLLDVVASEDAPQAGLANLDTLVAHVRRAGVPIDLEIEGSPRELPASLDLSAYRIVQEALTNVLKHSGASRAGVRVRYGLHEVEVEISDDGVGAESTGTGRGLAGMRERVSMLGGELVARSTPGGGFTVRARLPEQPA